MEKSPAARRFPPRTDGKTAEPVKVAISIQMNASISSLLLILHALETNQPYLFVDQLTVRAGQGRAYKPVPGRRAGVSGSAHGIRIRPGRRRQTVSDEFDPDPGRGGILADPMARPGVGYRDRDRLGPANAGGR